MCETTPTTPTLRRRSLLGAAMAGAGGIAVAGTIGAAGTGVAEAAPRRPGSDPRRPHLPVHSSQPKRHALTLLGTSGGPQAEYVRAGTSSVLTVGGRNYVVDAGRGSVTQYLNAGLRFSALGGMFVTHLHADHVADYFNYFMLEGGEANAEKDNLKGPLTVYGPGSAGALPPPAMKVLAPDNPVPGIADLTRRLNEGYAYSFNVLMRSTGTRFIEDLQDVHEIAVPPVGADATNTAPSMEPFGVFEDDRVKVSAILVPHGKVFPAFAFRFDTEAGSIVFSGDTRASTNVVKLAQGADVLVHEVMNLAFLKTVGHVTGDLLQHLEESHTTTRQVARIAERADVPHLVLTHLVPSNPRLIPDAIWHAECSIGYRGRVHVGNDLDRVTWRRR